MIGTMKKALEYAITKSENPTRIKEYMEEYFGTLGFKWKALSGNSTRIFSGIFEYQGKVYYFNKMGNVLELEYHNRKNG